MTATKLCTECGREHRDAYAYLCYACYYKQWRARGGPAVEHARAMDALRSVGRLTVNVDTLRDEGITDCHVCGDPVDWEADRRRDANAPTIDHIVPLSEGGSLDRSNVALAHRSHNTSRAWAARRSMDNRVTEGRLFQHTGI